MDTSNTNSLDESLAQRRTRSPTFKDLPGQIRNLIYQLYHEDHQIQLRTARFNVSSSRHAQQTKTALFYFTPPMCQVSRQIRLEYVSLIYRQATLVVDIKSNPSFWDAFVNEIGEDVIKEIAELEVVDLPGGCGLKDDGHVTMAISLCNTADPVTWNIRDCDHAYRDRSRGEGGLGMQLRAAEGIRKTVMRIEVEGGTRVLSRSAFKKILRFATLEQLHASKSLALWIVLVVLLVWGAVSWLVSMHVLGKVWMFMGQLTLTLGQLAASEVVSGKAQTGVERLQEYLEDVREGFRRRKKSESVKE